MFPSRLKRTGGILLHPTSLPGIHGIGDLGPSTFRFVDFLHESKQKIWQVLPLGPTGYGNSPYQCLSAFAGNPLLINPERLVAKGLLSREEINPPSSLSKDRVDYGQVITHKVALLKRAHDEFTRNKAGFSAGEYKAFVRSNDFWLEDFAVFMSLKERHDQKAWIDWEEPYRNRDPEVLQSWKKNHEKEVDFHEFTQFLFFSQWNDVMKYCSQKNIAIINDIPLFVAHDSADVWANLELFHTDKNGDLLYVAGVPPDYFSETGQRWGNPLYRWDVMKKRGYRWWIDLLEHKLKQSNIIRIDHFRGFESYWRIPAKEKTAVNGKWVSGPGLDFFLTASKKLGPLPVIAEDLGVITPAVEELLRKTGFPGMNVLQFAFGGPSDNRYLPHNHVENSVVYTGTHDNDTVIGWFSNASSKVREHVMDYLNTGG
ncbi:MAG: 4-alpha-glucanotransferase, partial [Candidatus Hodarchaeales archaeon]